MNIMDKSLNTMEKTTKKGKPAENQTPFSEMDENNGKNECNMSETHGKH